MDMEPSMIIYAVIATIFFLFIAKYDIHMFQLASYRYSRYFRWLIPGNIISKKRVFTLLMLIPALFADYLGVGFATGITIGSWVFFWNEKFKTPLVYTMRVKRLFATDIIIFVVIAVLAVYIKYGYNGVDYYDIHLALFHAPVSDGLCASKACMVAPISFQGRVNNVVIFISGIT